jgi:phage shock protein C
MQGKKLYRSRQDRVIAGVAGGLAEYFEIDSTLVRIIILILAIWGGFGILLYIIGAIVIPEAPNKNSELKGKEDNPKKDSKEQIVESRVGSDRKESVKDGLDFKKMSGEQIFGTIILALGVIFLLEAFIPGFSFSKLWPLVLVGIGLWLIASRGRE